MLRVLLTPRVIMLWPLTGKMVAPAPKERWCVVAALLRWRRGSLRAIILSISIPITHLRSGGRVLWPLFEALLCHSCVIPKDNLKPHTHTAGCFPPPHLCRQVESKRVGNNIPYTQKLPEALWESVFVQVGNGRDRFTSSLLKVDAQSLQKSPKSPTFKMSS